MHRKLYNVAVFCFLQDGRTPLHTAAVHNKTAVANVLLDHHAKANATDKVSSRRFCDVVLLQLITLFLLLLSMNVDVTLVDIKYRHADAPDSVCLTIFPF